MRNLTYEILKAKEYQKTWSKEKFEIIVETWRQADKFLVFDIDLDEQWARILKDNSIIGFLGIKIPILFLNDYVNIYMYNFNKDIHIIYDKNFDNKTWIIDLKKVNQSIPELIWHASPDAINPACLSINDFWYATI